MGLDVYLYKYSDFKKSKKNEKAYDDYSNKLYDTLEGIEDEQILKDARAGIRIKLEEKAKDLGLNDWGGDITYREKIELDSVLHPDHMFKIGYFRSSYNGGGINNVLRDLEIPGLYDIFEHNEDDYEFCPDWRDALRVVQESINLLKKDKGYRVDSVSANLFSPDDVPTSAAAALQIFYEQLNAKSKNKEFLSYSNKNGEFYLDKNGLKVHGLIPGKDMFQRPCTFVIYKPKDANKYYLEALEVVKETIEYVLAQENPQDFYLSWSA
jgi:hypothetical protein